MADEDRGVSSFDVRDYWEVLRRRKWVVAVAVVVVVVVAMGRSLRQDEVFRAQAEIEVEGDSSDSEVDIATEVRLVTSDDVREIAREHLPESAGEVFASQEAGTEILRVEAESTDPKVAAATANEYAHAYVEFRRSQRVQRLLEGVGQAEAKLTDVRRSKRWTQEEAAGRELIDDQVDRRAITASEAAERREALEEGITRKRNPLLDQQRVLETAALQAQINGESLTGGAEVIKAAEEPSDPIRPDPVKDLVAALAAGSLLGMVLAFGFEYLDDSINTSDDLSRAIGGDLPLLGDPCRR